MLYEIYVMVKHGNYSYSDMLIMPVYERKLMLDFLIDEAEGRKKRSDNIEKAN